MYELADQYPFLHLIHFLGFIVLPNVLFSLPLLESHCMVFCSNVVMLLCIFVFGVSLPYALCKHRCGWIFFSVLIKWNFVSIGLKTLKNEKCFI